MSAFPNDIDNFFSLASEGSAEIKKTLHKCDENTFHNMFYCGSTDLFNIIARGLPPHTEIFGAFDPSGKGAEIDIDGKLFGRVIFSAQSLRFERCTNKHYIYVKDVEVLDAPFKRKGMGSIFLDNLVHYANRAEFDLIKLRAGKDDGHRFWTSMGFVFDPDWHNPASRFRDTVERELQTLQDQITPEAYAGCLKAIEGLPLKADLAKHEVKKPYDVLANRRLLEVPYSYSDSPLGVHLMHKGGEIETQLRLQDDLPFYSQKLRPVAEKRAKLQEFYREFA